jgi:protein-S-isoprenylcysteine O-methyltransferase Ste14
MDVNITGWFFIAIGIWMLTCVVRTAYEFLKRKKPGLLKNKGLFIVMMAVMFFMWAAWGFACFADPVKMVFITWPRYIGAGVFVIGLGLFIFSDVAKQGVIDKGFLVTKGIYSRLRHPMYLGQFLMAVGLPFFARGLVTLCLSLVWIAQLYYWRWLEEQELLAKYPEYADYKKRTWF